MATVKEVLGEAYDDARYGGIGDEGQSEPTYAANAAEIILAALDTAGYVIVPKEPTEQMLGKFALIGMSPKVWAYVLAASTHQ